MSPLNIAGQLQDLKRLKDGWADGMQPASQMGRSYGKAPVASGLGWLSGQFARFYPDNLPRPYLYPTPEGGVQAEWPIGANEASLEIDLATRSAEWHCLDLLGGTADERTLELEAAADWEWLVGNLESLGRDSG